MPAATSTFTISTRGKGTYEITEQVVNFVIGSGVQNGIVTVFVRHTNCSLVIMENADPTARRDLEEFFERLVPEDTPYFEHTAEGGDDSTSHIRSVLTRSSEVIPIAEGRMQLGTWQIWIWRGCLTWGLPPLFQTCQRRQITRRKGWLIIDLLSA